MQVKAVVNIEVLDGEEKGQKFTFSTVGETDTTYTEYGKIERLRLEWRHIHDFHYLMKKRKEGEDV